MRRAVLALLTVSLLAAAPARADEGVAVAGPLAGGTLYAYDGQGGLCLELRTPTGGGGTCGDGVPRSPWETGFGTTSGRRMSWVDGAVPTEVAAVELLLDDGSTVRSATTAGEAYRGRLAGKVRFALVAYPAARRVLVVRQLDADGALLAVSDGYDDFGRPRPSRILHRDARATVRGYSEPFLAPTPLQLERFERRACVVVRGRGRTAEASALACAEPDTGLYGASLLASPSGSCEGLAIAGLAIARTRSVIVVLGDGSSVRLPTYAGGASLQGWRAFGTVLPPGIAVRSVLGLDGHGRGVGRSDVGEPPAGADCPPADAGESYGSGFLAISGGGNEPRRSVRAGDPALVAEDRGDLLCVAPGRLLPGLRDCRLPPVRPYEARLVGARGAGRTLLAGVVSPGVERVALVLDGGERLVLHPAPLPAYTGRYRDHVAFVSAVLPGRRSVLRVRVVSGGRATPWFVEGLDPPPRESATLIRSRGARLHASVIPGFPRDSVCVQLDDSFCLSSTLYLIDVRCGRSSGGTFAAGRMPHGARRVVGILRSGGRVVARVARVPARYPARRRAWLLTLRPDQSLARIVGVGGAGGASWQQLPPSSEQCGYGTFGALGLGLGF